jgi:hypothetical protein
VTDRVLSTLRAHGIDWKALTARCHQIVLFGSAARGETARDIDLLCIGGGWPVKTPRLDVTVISALDRHRPDWLAGLVANGVALDGAWLHGVDDWSHQARVCRFTLHQAHQIFTQRLALLRHTRDRRVYAEQVAEIRKGFRLLLRLLHQKPPISPS